jgi:hypothetical protein
MNALGESQVALRCDYSPLVCVDSALRRTELRKQHQTSAAVF